MHSWGSGEVGIGILHMHSSTCSCMGRLRYLEDSPQEAVVECLSLSNVLPVSLQFEERDRRLRAQASPTVNLVPRDALLPPWGLLIGILTSLGVKG